MCMGTVIVFTLRAFIVIRTFVFREKLRSQQGQQKKPYDAAACWLVHQLTALIPAVNILPKIYILAVRF